MLSLAKVVHSVNKQLLCWDTAQNSRDRAPLSRVFSPAQRGRGQRNQQTSLVPENWGCGENEQVLGAEGLPWITKGHASLPTSSSGDCLRQQGSFAGAQTHS